MQADSAVGRAVLSCLLVAISLTMLFPPPVAPSSLDRSDGADVKLEEVRRLIEQRGYSWKAGHTSLSRLSPEELRDLMATKLPENYDRILREIRSRPPTFPKLDLPSRFDWPDSVAPPPIREQLCGDCWAQAVTAGMEYQIRIHDHDTTSLAVQQVIDCNYGTSSCAGGFLWDACFLFTHVGAVAEECYPYSGTDMICGVDTCAIIAHLDSSEYIDTTVVSIKTHLMTYGPIPVAMGVPPSLRYYTGGCYESDEPWQGWHGLLIIGWEDTMCAGKGAWHLWNSSGTDWGEDGFAWIKYGTAHIGADAQVLHYTSKGAVQLAVDSFTIDDSSGDADSVADPGESVVVTMNLSNSGWLTATGVSATLGSPTPGITIINGSATFPDIDPDSTGQSAPPHFAFSIDANVLCGRIAKFVVSIASDQGVATDDFEVKVGDTEIAFFDDAETDLGWSKGAPDDDATTGVWRRKNPIGTATETCLVQPELDYTPGSAVRCFVTSNLPRGMVVDGADVDGGKTTLTSPVMDLSAHALAALRYRRWYTNDTGGPADDSWVVDVSADSGTTWVNLETQMASERAWVQTEFDLNSEIALTDKVLVRFVASDYGDDSTVEAAVDDIEVVASPYWVDALGPSVAVVSPNGGEEITEETQFEVTWTAGDDYGLRRMLVLASYDSGVTFTDTLGTSLWPDTSLSWNVPAGEHPDCKVRVEATDRGYNTAVDESDSTFSITRDISGAEPEIASGDPAGVELIGSEKNPFTGMTHIFYWIPAGSDVRMSIYNVRGQIVRTLVNGHGEAGYHSCVWDGRSDSGSPAASGVYFIHLSASGIHRTTKAILER